MDSYEKDILNKMKSKVELPEKLSFSLLKYFWQNNPLSRNRKDAIPYFLGQVEALKNFSENELRILTHYLHLRTFNPREVIFEQGDVGVGFYFIFSGEVEILAQDQDYINEVPIQLSKKEEPANFKKYQLITTLKRYDHFGELALLQENSLRTASAVAKTECTLLGVFKPDMEKIIYYDAIVGGKLLQSISVILANRLAAITNEIRAIKENMMDYGLND